MQDIADHLHISKNSVSQALTGKDGVSEATRALVKETAERLGYVYRKSRRGKQNEAAASPASTDPSAVLQDGGTIALIASDYAFSRKSFFGDIYLSVDKELKKYGYELVIQSISPEDAEALRLPAFLENLSVDGILILSHITTPYVQAVLDTGIPAVLIDHHHPSLQADSILTNNRFSAYEGVRHLIELGHKDIGFMGDIDYSPSHYERLEGMRLAAFEAADPASRRLAYSRRHRRQQLCTRCNCTNAGTPDRLVLRQRRLRLYDYVRFAASGREGPPRGFGGQLRQRVSVAGLYSPDHNAGCESQVIRHVCH